jgi:hypothetical protein
MKRFSFFLLLCLLNIFCGFSQEIINDVSLGTNAAIHQISTSGIDNILSFQTLNQGNSNFVLAQQIGDQNKASINQQRDPGTAFTNQSYTFQQGSFNELLVGQIGSGNLLLSFQLGYIATELGLNQANQPLFSLGNANGDIAAIVTQNKENGIWADGIGNKIEITQEGDKNGIMAVQQGDNNSISAGQTGTNNNLLILQKGNNNLVTGYKQENSSDNVMYDTIIQEGESLSLNASDASKSKLTGNIFSQSGINLSLQVNNGFVNSLGGIEITQTGKDMKVVVDQSYFPFPIK